MFSVVVGLSVEQVSVRNPLIQDIKYTQNLSQIRLTFERYINLIGKEI